VGWAFAHELFFSVLSRVNTSETAQTSTPRPSVRKIAILQSNYIPWLGYFDIIHSVDAFVVLDDVQYTKNDWRNRNKLRVAQGTQWLTVPILTHGRAHQKICEARIKNETKWFRKHFRTIECNYARASYYRAYSALLRECYLEREWELLSELNMFLIKSILGWLGIGTEIIDSRELNVIDLSPEDPRSDRVLQICRKLGATDYLSGPAAKAYLNLDMFEKAGIKLHFMDYSGYPEYSQQFPRFEPQVSVLDLILNCGPHAPQYIWGWRQGSDV